MTAAAILNFEKLMPFSYCLTNFHKFVGDVATLNNNTVIYYIAKRLVTGIKHGGCRPLEFRKTDTVVQTPNENTFAL